MRTLNRNPYTRRNAGDIVNGAILVRRVGSGQRWVMKCQCGSEFIAQPSASNGLCRKCAMQKCGESMVLHGESHRSGGKPTRLYNIWLCMRGRCNNPKNPSYKHYGERGIKVCAEWDSYEAFSAWAKDNGYKNNLTLDRIDVNGNYSPGNCRWASIKDQQNNRRNNHYVEVDGVEHTISEWSEISGIKATTIRRRLKTWTAKEAVFTPVKGKPECVDTPWRDNAEG